ncbi:MAG: efflux RND transporter periplasmic adaptor subunit, partial [Alphaproteobacteria bacterium]
MVTATRIARVAPVAALMLLLVACGDDGDTGRADNPPVRGLKTIVVKDQERTTERKYPSVLQPSSISTLSFEIGGKLIELNLNVGQVVKTGDVLARIDPTNLALQVDSAEAGLRRAQSGARTARDDNQRKVTLLSKGVITKAAADQAKNALEGAQAELVQAQKQRDTALKNLSKAVLKAPFDGVIHTVEADTFANVAAGVAIATIYSVQS